MGQYPVDPNAVPQTDIGYSPKITLPYAAYFKNHTNAIMTTNASAEIGVCTERLWQPWPTSYEDLEALPFHVLLIAAADLTLLRQAHRVLFS